MTDEVDIIPDALGPVQGYRVFGLAKDSEGKYRLRSTGVQGVWPTGRHRAVCRSHNSHSFVPSFDDDGNPVMVIDPSWAEMHGPIPSRSCGCGYWIVKTPEDLWARGFGHGYVVAEVRGWGRVLDHKAGYRTEFAEVMCLIPGPWTPDPAVDAAQARDHAIYTELCETYDCALDPDNPYAEAWKDQYGPRPEEPEDIGLVRPGGIINAKPNPFGAGQVYTSPGPNSTTTTWTNNTATGQALQQQYYTQVVGGHQFTASQMAVVQDRLKELRAKQEKRAAKLRKELDKRRRLR